MKKITNVVLLLTMFFMFALSFPIDVQAKEKDEVVTATTFKLEKSEGEVTVKNAKGKKIKFKDGQKLYNGYSVLTEDGYAWISTDKDRIFKIDNDSKIIVQKKNKKMNILLKKGNLMFAVNKPLEADERLSIRTSTMSTGIRGTLGVVSVSEYTDYYKHTIRNDFLNLLEGKVELSYYDSLNNEIHSEQVNPGETYDVNTVRKETEGVANIPVSVTKMEDKDLLTALKEFPFVLTEVRDNEDIYNRLLDVETTDKVELDDLIEQTDDLLNNNRLENAQKREENKKLDDEAAQSLEEDKNVVDHFFEDESNLMPAPIGPVQSKPTEIKPQEPTKPEPKPEPKPTTCEVVFDAFEDDRYEKPLAHYDGYTQSVTCGSKLVLPTMDAGKMGEGHWEDQSNNKVTSETIVNSDLSLTWKPLEHTVTFERQHSEPNPTFDNIKKEKLIDGLLIPTKLIPSDCTLNGHWETFVYGETNKFKYETDLLKNNVTIKWIPKTYSVFFRGFTKEYNSNFANLDTFLDKRYGDEFGFLKHSISNSEDPVSFNQDNTGVDSDDCPDIPDTSDHMKYGFGHWEGIESLSKKHIPIDKYTKVNENLDVYWVPDSYTIKFMKSDYHDGDAPISSEEFLCGMAFPNSNNLPDLSKIYSYSKFPKNKGYWHDVADTNNPKSEYNFPIIDCSDKGKVITLKWINK